MTIGKTVEYVDESSVSHEALVTQVWGSGEEFPSVNLIYVSGDPNETDQYGRQIKRAASIVHQSQQSAQGRYWQ